MSTSVNKATLLGRLTRDPETRTTNAGGTMVTFGLATSDRWRDRATGEEKERTEYHNIVVFHESLAKIVETYCRKGTQVYLEGQIQTRKYMDREGNERSAMEIVLQGYNSTLTLLGKPTDGEDSAAKETPEPSPAKPGAKSAVPPLFGAGAAPSDKKPPLFPSGGDVTDDQIPF